MKIVLTDDEHDLLMTFQVLCDFHGDVWADQEHVDSWEYQLSDFARLEQLALIERDACGNRRITEAGKAYVEQDAEA